MGGWRRHAVFQHVCDLREGRFLGSPFIRVADMLESGGAFTTPRLWAESSPFHHHQHPATSRTFSSRIRVCLLVEFHRSRESTPSFLLQGPIYTKQVTLPLSHYNLHFASNIDNVSNVLGKPKSKRRSRCPVSISLEMFGDRWSLLIIRDLMVRGFRTFKEFQESGEGISTNILADRLRKLEARGIITAEVEETDRRRVNYRLTEKGIDLAPVLLELLVWASRHEETGASAALIGKMAKHREAFLAEVRRRWRERDPTPLIPKFGDGGGGANWARTRREA